MKKLSVQSHDHSQYINVTRVVQEAVTGLGVRDGAITLFVPHTTAGVTINECADPDVVRGDGEGQERGENGERGWREREALRSGVRPGADRAR